MRNPSGKLVTAAVLSVLALTLAASCSSPGTSGPASGGQKTNVVVGAVPAETGAAMYIAQEHGIFAAHGLHVTIRAIQSTSDILPEMAKGSINIASGQLPSFIMAEVGGTGSFRLLASGLTLSPGVNEILAMKWSGITDPAQLRHKTIAENAPIGDSPLLVDSVLASYGMKPTQVTVKIMGFPDMGAALAAHQVDAAYCVEPYCTDIQQKYGAEVIADTDQGAAQGLLTSGYTVTAKWLENNKKTAAEFAASIAEGATLADTNPADLQRALAASLHLSPQVADVMATGTFPTTVDPVKISQVADLMLTFGEIKRPFDVSRLLGS
jgi:ABC-type nitrate/sulfonate/bicarbonate transport system substrate-binding protein